MSAFLRHLTLAAALLAGVWLHAAERIPPAPAQYFNDYAGVVPGATAAALNARLEQFERETSNQLLVAVYPKMETDSSVEDYTVRVAQAWHAGQKAKNNGAVLFVFMAEHQLYIQVGYGLEGALPDATCHAIIENELKPRFRAGDYAGGLTAAVNAMIAATRGEYRGTGRTQAEGAASGGMGSFAGVFFIVLLFMVLGRLRMTRPYVLMNPGRRGVSSIWWSGPGGGGGFGGGSFGGGGGFSGGGGGFGGGGAGGSW